MSTALLQSATPPQLAGGLKLGGLVRVGVGLFLLVAAGLKLHRLGLDPFIPFPREWFSILRYQ